MRAVDAMGASGAGRIQTFKASDLAELARVSEEAWRRIEAREPAYALRLTRAALLEGVLDVRREVEGRNVQTNAWRTAKWQALRDGTSLRITHLEVGTGSGTP
ncbi:MAG TPA: hypothetical protein VFH78_10320, partial [Candidatus Thermoplasmatota archaeon]|nr:hypothetical protein [Candidatus Thermoplasmatota archaeon]